MIGYLRRLWLQTFPRYERLELKYCTYMDADYLMKLNADGPEEEQWVLAMPEEDNNHVFGMVYIERKKRILN